MFWVSGKVGSCTHTRDPGPSRHSPVAGNEEVSDYGAPLRRRWVSPFHMAQVPLDPCAEPWVPVAPVFQIRKHKTEVFYAEILRHKSTPESLGEHTRNSGSALADLRLCSDPSIFIKVSETLPKHTFFPPRTMAPQASALPISNKVALGKLLHLPEPQFLLL